MTVHRLIRGLLPAACLLLAGAAWGADKITECAVDGALYKKIFDVHEMADGRVGIYYHIGGITVDRSKLSAEFLQSWSIRLAAPPPKPDNAAPDQSNATWLDASRTQEVGALARAGLIRKVGQTFYNLRKSPPGWETISGARVVVISQAGALLEAPDRPENSRYIVVANLPMVQNANDTVTAMVKLTGFEKRLVKNLGEIMVGCYDYGEVCAADEAPVAILETGVFTPSAGAWSTSQPHNPAGAATGGARRSGSGFFVSSDGLLLTSYHVVAGAAKVAVRHEGKILPATIRQVSATNDLALLHVEGSGFKWLPLAAQTSAGLGESVFTIGFPNPNLQGVEPKYCEGAISGLDGYRDDPREYQMSVAVQPGNSGGPVCNAVGQVVGIVRAELDADYALLHSGSLPQNVNYAVKSKYALDLLQSANAGKDFYAGVVLAGGESAEAIRDRARDAVAMVLVY